MKIQGKDIFTVESVTGTPVLRKEVQAWIDEGKDLGVSSLADCQQTEETISESPSRKQWADQGKKWGILSLTFS